MTPVIIFMAVIFLLAIYSWISSYQEKQKRLQLFQTFAFQNGWAFSPNMAIEYFQNYDYYALFTPQQGYSKGYSKRITASMKKPFDGGEVLVCDYSYTMGDGRSSRKINRTVTAFHTPHLQIPYFALRPESLLGVLAEFFGYKDIDFASHPNFSERFKLSGQDELPIRHFFHPQVLSFFENVSDVRVDGGGNYLFVYTTEIPIEGLNAFINFTYNVYGLFRR